MADLQQRLVIQKNPVPTGSDPSRYYVSYQGAMGNLPKRRQLVGFSYFGEVAGLRQVPTGSGAIYITLDGAGASANWRDAISSTSESTRVRMNFKQWFGLLAEHKINFSRVFVYPDVEPGHYPFKRVDNSLENPRYDLTIRGTEYFDLLRLYIDLARQKNIVVQISLAGIQTLRPDKWEFHPMNGKHEPNGIYHCNVNGWLDTANGREKFTVMRRPEAAAVTEAEKNYVTQSNTLDWILEASSWAWNVVYELFNEPGGVENLSGEIDWLMTTAKWLDERLRHPATNQRTHLVSMNAGPNLRNPDNKNIFKRMLFDGAKRRARPLIDIYSFHGDQWGGDPGHSVRPPLNSPLRIEDIVTATRNSVNAFYDEPIDTAGNTIMGSPVALICDSDAHYRAQDSAKLYATAVMKDLKLNYNYRWSKTWLSQKMLCDQIGLVRDAIPVETPPA